MLIFMKINIILNFLLIYENILQRFINLDHPYKILFISKKWHGGKYKFTNGTKIVKTKYQNECPDGYTLYRENSLLHYLSV